VRIIAGSEHIALKAQITDQKSLETAFKDAIEQFSKPPTIIVNSAGIIHGHSSMTLSNDGDLNDLNDEIDIKMKGTFLLMQTAVKAMLKANVTKDSSIINISSVIGKCTNNVYNDYSVSQAGVMGITKTVSKQFGKYVF